jgi:hypothetical protein
MIGEEESELTADRNLLGDVNLYIGKFDVAPDGDQGSMPANPISSFAFSSLSYQEAAGSWF